MSSMGPPPASGRTSASSLASRAGPPSAREPREGLVAQLLEQPAPLDEQRSVPLDRDRLERGAPPRACLRSLAGEHRLPDRLRRGAGLGDDPLALPLRRGAHLARLARGLLLEDAQELAGIPRLAPR